MSFLLLIVAAVTSTAQDLLRKQFSLRCTGGNNTFNTLSALTATAFFAFFANWGQPLSWGLIGHAAGFAASYFTAFFGLLLAIQYGSLAKTSLILSYSLLLPTAAGLLFWDEPFTTTMGIGFLLLVVSLFLTNYQKEEGAQKVSFKWLVFVLLAFVGNGMCSITQRLGQAYDPGGGMLMLLALAIVTAVCFVIMLCTERGGVAISTVKKGGGFAIGCGLLNALTNFLVVLLNKWQMPASVLFPVIAAGGMVVTLLFSVLLYKERFGKMQWAGFVIGIGAIILLNL